MVGMKSKLAGRPRLDIDGHSASALDASRYAACRHKSSLLICVDRPFSATVITTVVCSRCSVLAVERWSKHDLWASAFAPWSQVSFAVPCICRGWNVVRRMWDSPECGVVKVSIRSRKLSGDRKRARLQCQHRIVDASPKQ
jgi:hypothetical protein